MDAFNLSMLLTGQYHEWLLNGLLLSIQLALMTLVFALPLGVLIAVMRVAPVALLRGAAIAYVEAVRNVPLLAHMLFWYFGAPEFLPDSAKAWLYEGNVEATSAVIALVFYTAAYMSEDLRSGIRGIPRGQAEAANSLGFGFLNTFRLVVLPQALRATVPPLLGQAMTITKNTTVAMMIGVTELASVTQAVQDASFLSAGVYAFTSVFFLLIAVVLTGLGQWYQRRFPKG